MIHPILHHSLPSLRRIPVRFALVLALFAGLLLTGSTHAAIGNMEGVITLSYGVAKEEQPCKVPGIDVLKRGEVDDYVVWVGYRKVKDSVRGLDLKSVYESFQGPSDRFIADKELGSLLDRQAQGRLWGAPREVILPSVKDFRLDCRRENFGIYMQVWVRNDQKFVAVYKSEDFEPRQLGVDHDVFVVLDLDLYNEVAWQKDLFGPVIDFARQDKGNLSKKDVVFESPMNW